MEYTDPRKMAGARRTPAPASGQTRSGYGGKIPTSVMINYDGRWHRVYVMQYSNAGTAYIIQGGQNLILDIDTQYAITEAEEN